MSTPRCALASCGVELIHDPAHPGHELGTWYVHPGGAAGSLIGHTAAAVIPPEETPS